MPCTFYIMCMYINIYCIYVHVDRQMDGWIDIYVIVRAHGWYLTQFILVCEDMVLNGRDM